MSNTTKIVIAIALVAIGFVLGAAIVSNVPSRHVGALVNDVSYLVGDVYQGSNQTLEFTGGNFVGNIKGATIGGSSNTALNTYNCATATWNPGSLSTSTIGNATSTDIALSGAVMGDTCSASLTSATSSAVSVRCNITGSGTSTISITNLGTTNAAIDVATGTAKVCYLH